MNTSYISSAETTRNYTKPGYGCVKLCRDLLIVVADRDAPIGVEDTYSVTVSILNNFEVDIESVKREGPDEGPLGTTQYTLTDDAISELAHYYFND